VRFNRIRFRSALSAELRENRIGGAPDCAEFERNQIKSRADLEFILFCGHIHFFSPVPFGGLCFVPFIMGESRAQRRGSNLFCLACVAQYKPSLCRWVGFLPVAFNTGQAQRKKTNLRGDSKKKLEKRHRVLFPIVRRFFIISLTTH
jgi:hypothetical protein